MSYHVYYHEDHLLLFVRQLDKVHLRQLKLVVHLEYVLISGQCIDSVIIRNRGVLIHLHSCCATAHRLNEFC